MLSRWVAVGFLLVAGGTLPAAEGTVDFARDIQPVLEARCLSCHGAAKQRGGLRLDIYEGKIPAADSGPVIVPGQSAHSSLIQRLEHADPKERMPQNAAPLSPPQIAAIRAWIDAGAAWPSKPRRADSEPKAHWAFRPLTSPPLPQVKAGGLAANPVDRFIQARLERAGLAFSPEADRASLIRRLKLDLLGLPPTPEETLAFVADPDPLAYEKLVDRYLASPHFGERWARHWLDVVRFAETDGFEMNAERPNAWPYRDYVIAAFNQDRPYDRFVAEQLAGDVLGADEATGFLVGGPVDRVKSPDITLTLQQRADELHDMIGTTGSTFLGLTVGCARCHNHKFDPIPQVDYYRLKAVFAGVQHGERERRGVDLPEREKQREAIQGQLASLERQWQAHQPHATNGRAPVVGAAKQKQPVLRPPVTAGRNLELFEPVEARWLRLTILASQGEPCIDELEVFTAEPQPRNIALADQGTQASASGTLPGFAIHRLEHINDGRYGNGRSWISSEAGRGWVELAFPKTVRIDRIAWGRDQEGKFQDRVPTRYRFEVAVKQGEWHLVASSDDRLPTSSEALLAGQSPQGPEERRALQAYLAEKKQLTDRLEALAKSAPLAYAGTFTPPGAIRRLHRGDPQQEREPVQPGALGELGPPLRLPMDAPESERRLALARWLTDPRNPLPARVLVNRLWHYHFGRGIVHTPSDFGINGGQPSHPELLDWLASRLIEGGWRMKPIHRLLVTSRTYRQASTMSQRGAAVDAGARLLWRYPPRRLEAEPLRDSILQISGNLSLRMGGPGFSLFEPNSNYVRAYTPKKTFGPNEWRRLVYQAKPRMQLDDTFGAFDCPDAGQIAPSRTSSTTALQALNLLNSRFLIQQSQLFAERLRREAGADPRAQVERGFLLAFQRPPSPEEREAALGLLAQADLAAFCRALFNASELLFVY